MGNECLSASKQPKKNSLQPWVRLRTREIFVAMPWIQLSVDQVRLPDGKVVDDYYQIKLPDYAMVFAQTADGKVIMERLYKHGIGKVSLALPAGLVHAGEDPLAGAQRELLEETGYISNDWRPLGSFVVNGTYGCGKAYLFAALHAELAAEPSSGDLEEMEIIQVGLEEVAGAIRNGDVVSLSTAAAIALATSPLFASCHNERNPQFP